MPHLYFVDGRRACLHGPRAFVDGQRAGVFDESPKFLADHKVALAPFFTPAPSPGTAYHEEMRHARRILNEGWWRRCGRDPRLVKPAGPAGMDGSPAQSGRDGSHTDFYARRERAAYLVANVKTWHFLKKKKNPSAWGTIS